MKQTFVSIAILFLAFPLLFSQSRVSGDVLERLREKESMGQMTITMDSLVEVNYHKHLLQNYRNRGVAGYRIRIFSDNGPGAKENQQRIRVQFLSLYPDIAVYYRYEGSYYKVYVGDFRTKNEAMVILGDLQKDFPDAFIVDDDIKIDE